MADPANYVNPERDIEQALVALKKGTQLIKYSRKGKPKLCPFRVSTDETTLIWYSRGRERNLKLAIVSKIIAGQRTAVFRRYSRAEKDYLSFSLLYNNGERSLDLVCKDKVEADVWFAGLKALIGSGQRRRSRIDGSDDGTDYIQDWQSLGASLEATSGISRSSNTKSSIDSIFCEPSLSLTRSDVGSDRANMQLRQSNGDGVRLSVSSALSSSHSSGPDDCESLGDVYVWGEVWSDGTLANGPISSISLKTDVLLPKPLESNVVLDVHQIACGARHAALVTRQGEVFTWGEEAGGRLGLGHDRDNSRPQLIESLAVYNMDFVACGEFHTCAVSLSGDLFSWGDGSFNAGLLGHGTGISHWIPKQISGHLEGLQVLSVACGSWHSALATSGGKLFTFGDGTFGVLGHGDRESILYPREVQSLSGLKTIKVACGVYHTAAIVEVTGQFGVNVISRKLFTWGDGDKHRLGHGDKEARLVPTCVSSLIDYNFHQLACGNTITVALTTSGHVFTMGSTIHGQLGNPQSDGRLPCLVQDKLVGELVEEISCGAFHVAILTSRSEVFTWGNGANGRLGHGDTEDRKTPTIVEALKDRHVKSVACGSNFTAAICIHKWVSGADQSVCSGCRQAFGFTRKRHNCYNCGLVHCHACSSKKALKAALAPTPGKPHRVCDSCYAKLKASEAGSSSIMKRRHVAPRRSIDNRERLDRNEMRSSRLLLSPQMEPVKYLEVRSAKHGMKSESLSLVRASQVPSLLQLKDIAFPSSLSALQTAFKPIVTSTPQPLANSRPTSPYSRRPSPPRSATSMFSRSAIDNLKKTNEVLNQEILKMQAQIKNLKQKCDNQDVEILKLKDKSQESASLAAEEFPTHAAAKELIISLATQLKNVTEKLLPGTYDTGSLASLHSQVENFLEVDRNCSSECSTIADSSEIISVNEGTDEHNQKMDDCGDVARLDLSHTAKEGLESMATISDSRHAMVGSEITVMQYEKMDDGGDVARSDASETAKEDNETIATNSDSREAMARQNLEIGSKSPKMFTMRSHTEAQVVEQFERGVYVTLVQLPNGTKIFKRVRFSKRRFAEQQAEEWWKENKERVYKRYNYRGMDSTQTGMGSGLDVNPSVEAGLGADAIASGAGIGTDADSRNTGWENDNDPVEEDKASSS